MMIFAAAHQIAHFERVNFIMSVLLHNNPYFLKNNVSSSKYSEDVGKQCS